MTGEQSEETDRGLETLTRHPTPDAPHPAVLPPPPPPPPPRARSQREWLVTDGFGGFASGSADGIRTRRYHAFLVAAAPHNEHRFVLVNDLELTIETRTGPVALSSHRYAPNVVHPDGATRLVRFDTEPWPVWTYDLEDGVQVVQQLFSARTAHRAAMVLQWRVIAPSSRGERFLLRARPLLSGRDFHALHRENPAFDFRMERLGKESWQIRPYAGVPAIVMHANAEYDPDPLWFRQFLYLEERARGLDDSEDLASPGTFVWQIGGSEAREASLMLTVPEDWMGYSVVADLSRECAALRESERARVAAFKSRLHHSGDEYLVRRGERDTIIAGYPWFTDWGRDTFIALRGLCLEAGRLDEAQRVLLAWCDTLSEGMLPNVFPAAAGVAPSYNAVDASLWYVIVAQAFLDACTRRDRLVDPAIPKRLTDASQEILEAYSRGTRYGIHADDDGLLAAGEPGVALTWMDAMIDGAPVTPRIGKPVEIQALWVNALTIGSRWSERWGDAADQASESFGARFWNDSRQCLYDVVDVDHLAGTANDQIRPNQILAVGGLRIALLAGARARSVVDVVERELWTPMGLRTLSPSDPGYRPACAGSVAARDGAYHNGAAWPWLIGPFVDAWVRVRAAGGGPWAARSLRVEAKHRFLGGLARHLDAHGVGHISELADGEEPWTPRGCPFQAWSVGEMLRLLAD